MMPMDLALVRHGESEGNVAVGMSKNGDDSAYTPEFKARHSSQWRLTDKGIWQAQMAGEWIRKNIAETFFRYMVSEYVRAKETAAHLGMPGAIWHPNFYLIEREWGDLDVMSKTEIMTQFRETWERRAIEGFFHSFPNGESMLHLCHRLERPLDTLHRECSQGSVLSVNHGDVMWGYRVILERMPIRYYQELDRSKDPIHRIHNGQIIHYTRRNPDNPAEISDHLDWMRSVCPWDESLSTNVWQRIERPKYTNEDLLAEVATVRRLIAG